MRGIMCWLEDFLFINYFLMSSFRVYLRCARLFLLHRQTSFVTRVYLVSVLVVL